MQKTNFPPVQWLSPLEPFSQPQFLPGSPHNLPKRPDPAVGHSTSQPFAGDVVATREPYRYASFVSLNVVIGTSNIKFLDQPIGKRNFLGFRNASIQNIYIDFGAQANQNSWLALVPGQIVIFDTVVPQDDLYCVSDGIGATLSYVYSTFPG